MEVVTNAKKTYLAGKERLTVFDDLSLTVEPGATNFILGPNGCGKSTLLRILTGAEVLDEGVVGLVLAGHDLAGVVTQNYRDPLLPWASVSDNLLIAHRSADPLAQPFVERCLQYIRSWGYELSARARVMSLSGGQQQAIVLARALAFEPEILIWDEPFSAVDFARRQAMYRTVRAYCEHPDRNAFMTTHDLDQALRLADRVLVYDTGMKLTVDLRVEVSAATRLEDSRGTGALAQLREQILAAIASQSR
ncbi:MAG: ATP-binding cassette domain-containing protein [Myxococcales bacterium]|nr:ATP-binding cassette domain-containing protein [Myxococcales bacterium]